MPGGTARPVSEQAERGAGPRDEHGHFVRAAPDVLHGLTPAQEPGARAGDGPGPDDVRRAERWLQLKRSVPKVAELRQERAREIELRREYLERSFHELVKRRRNAWGALAAKVAGGDESFKLARDEAQRMLEETERRRDHKLRELSHLEVLRPAPASYLGSAIVAPAEDGDVTRMARQDPEVDRIAVEVAMAYEEASGRRPLYIGD